MNILVTGGAGFIGSHLVEKLLHEKNIVTAYDNLSSGKKANLKNCIEHKKFCFVEDDLLNAESLNRAMAGIEVVWHLAANTDIRKGNHTVDLDLKNCTVATFNVLEAMRKNSGEDLTFMAYLANAPDVAFHRQIQNPLTHQVNPNAARQRIEDMEGYFGS